MFSLTFVCSLASAKIAQAAFLKKGPYLVYPGANTQMTVLWQLDSTSIANISWGTDPTASEFTASTAEYGSDHQHSYTITNLTPGRKYYYQ